MATGDLVIGTESGCIYFARLKMTERKWAFDGDALKLVHVMPSAVTGIDFESY